MNDEPADHLCHVEPEEAEIYCVDDDFDIVSLFVPVEQYVD